MPRVTALRPRPRGRVLVEVDGEEWLVLRAQVVVRARLAPGAELDRERLLEVARERRRADALAEAGSALRVRDLPSRRLEQRLAQRGVAAGARAEALKTLQGLGLVDDERYARNRALALAGRAAGDAAIRHDLEQQGLPRDLIDEAISGLEPERLRAERIVDRRGRSHATARFLARKGFGEDVVEGAAGEVLG
jgi:SOS response regulatory protein OraA/RecX